MTSETTAHDASALCQQCGLCCAGLLFERVSFKPDELQNIANVDFKIFESGKRALPHPCQFLAETRCSIYADRPSNCRSFSCVLRRQVMNGEQSLDDGAAQVAQVKEYLHQLNSMALEFTGKPIAELGFREFSRQFLKAMERKTRKKILPSEDEQTSIVVCFEAIKVIDRYFRKTSRLNKFADLIVTVEDLKQRKSVQSADH